VRSTTLNLALLLLTLGCAGQNSSTPTSRTPDSAPFQFRSGFEPATTVSGAHRSASNTWVESLQGRDGQAAFSWPGDLPGDPSRSGFFYLVDGDEDIRSIIETRIDDATGRGSTRALYQAVLKDHQSTASRARNQYSLLNSREDVFAEGAVRYWLKLQPNLKEILPAGSWRQVMEWREQGDLYRKAVMIMPDAATGEPYWTVFADFGPRWDRDWTAENRAIRVPLGEWILLEAYWKEGSGSDGRLLVKINCQTLADHVGRTRNQGPIFSVDLFKVYAAPESLALGPSYQWIDDVEVSSTLSNAGCP